MKEAWKDIITPVNYKGYYQISNLGNIKSLERKQWLKRNNCYATKKEKILNPSINSAGYFQINIYKNGISSYRLIHLLVWDHFGDKPRNGHKLQVDHIDEDKLNNAIWNLQLKDNRANCSKGKFKYNKSSKYTGVCWSKRDKIWVSRIQINGKIIHLGSFKSEFEAHIAYQNKLELINKYTCSI